MARYSTDSKHSISQLTEMAEDFFGLQGLGLSNTSQDECCLSFTGGGGYVSITIRDHDGKRHVELDVSEWDAHIPRFLRKIN